MNDYATGFERTHKPQICQYLSFLLGGEEYAIEILRVREIRCWEGAAPLPNAPTFVKGMINLRGAIVPIIDLRARFNLPHETYGQRNVVIVVQVEATDKVRTMGVVVDAVSEVHDIPVEGLCPKPDLGRAMDSDFIKGIATVESKMVIVLDIDRLLDPQALEQTTQECA